MSAEIERLAAEFEKFQAKIRQAEVRFSGVGEMQGRLAELEVVATSPDRAVRVVAGPGGAVKDIQLGADAMRRPAQALAATIMATLREAVAEAVRQQAGIVDETVGGAFGVSTGEQVRQAQAEALGTAVDELTSHHGTAERAPAQPDDHDQDFDQDFDQDDPFGTRGRRR